MGYTPPPPIQFRAAHLLPDLRARQDGETLGAIARRDLARYYAVLRAELARVALSEPEALTVVAACNGTYWEPHTLALLPDTVAVALDVDGLADAYGVDSAALVATLRALTPAQCAAVVDAAERYWAAPNEADRLRTVGLVS